MRTFKVDDVAVDEFEEAAAWYEGERPGLDLMPQTAHVELVARFERE